MSGGGGTTTTSQYPPWAALPAAGDIGLVGQYVNRDLAAGYNPQFNQQIAPFNSFQNQGFESGLNAAGLGPWAIDPTLQNVAATQSGAFLNPSSNPYLAATFNAAAQPLTTQFRDATAPGINGMFAQSGSFGGSANQQEMSDAQQQLGNSLSNLATGIYGGNYQQERQNQLAQQGMLGSILGASYMPSQELLSLGGQQQQETQSQLDASRQNALQQEQFPFDILNNLTNTISGVVGNNGTVRMSSGGKGFL